MHKLWFASLIGWMGGLHSQADVVEELRAAAELIIRGAEGNW